MAQPEVLCMETVGTLCSQARVTDASALGLNLT